MPTPMPSALDRARSKAYRRLLPLLFLCYAIAYVDRVNVSIAKLTMTDTLPNFNDEVIGFGAGVFFFGYFLLEIPGTLIVEKWSARKWISRIMISWGIIAAMTAYVKTPWQFYTVRFFLGLAEAGFFPGVIVYLTHWFPSRDRARALASFFIATPIAQTISPKLSNLLLGIGRDGQPPVMGMVGWQWVYIAWGIPAVILGIMVFFMLTDRPRHALWLTDEERDALETELEREKAVHKAGRHISLIEAFAHPKVLWLCAAYCFVVTSSYGVEIFLPSILRDWYHLDLNQVTWLVVLPPIGALIGQLFIGWSSDRTKERRLHAALPIYVGALALLAAVWARSSMWLTVALFVLAATGLKAYLPAFWSMPSLFLTQAAAAGSIGLINSVGNLGGFFGPVVLGTVKTWTGSFQNGILFLVVTMSIAATILLTMGLGHRVVPAAQAVELAVEPESIIEPV